MIETIITWTILFIAGMCVGFIISGLMQAGSDADDKHEAIFLKTREEYYNK